MFEKQKWSQALKKAVRKFQRPLEFSLHQQDELAELINLAIEEGREGGREEGWNEAQDQVNEWYTPERDESRD